MSCSAGSGGAWLTHEETVKGRLAPGYLADLVVLDRDYFTCDAAVMPVIQVELTLIGGSIVCQA